MSRDDLVATYLASLPEGREHAIAEAFAVGQTIGTWTPVPGITDEMRATYGGRVVEVRPIEPGERVGGEEAPGWWVLRVGFPLANFGPSMPMLFTTLLGNDPSTSIGARLVDIDVPSSFAAGFPGPQAGIAGWRAIAGVPRGPLLLNMIKPCTGYPPEVGAGFVREVALGGVDWVKDDELLGSPAFNHVRDRARAYARTLDEVAVETGHRTRYIANVTGRVRDLVGNAAAAVEGRADALMVNGLALGLDAVAELVESRPGVPVFVHTAGVETFTGGARSGFGHALLIGKLLRLVGADGALTSTPFAPRPLPESVFRATVAGMRAPWLGLRPTIPVVGGGLTAAHVPDLVAALGEDVMIGVGGAIQGHPAGATAGARVVRAAIGEAMAAVTSGTGGAVAPAPTDEGAR
jgi:2,3-diketo-5-methylthiopentyl-1-phosphate enolase